MTVNACGASHRGNRRGHNEDNIYVDGVYKYDLSEDNVLIRSRRRAAPYVYAVFDGLGGEACGEDASLTAAVGLKAMEDINAERDIDTYIAAAHKAIINESLRNNAPNMGTTVASLQIFDSHATAFNVGDSRVYLYRNGSFTRMTRDHSVVQSLIDKGIMQEEERYASRYAAELTQYIGMAFEDGVEPCAHRVTVNICPGDIFLLCSDGLCGEMSDRELCGFLDDNKNESPEAIAVRLIKRAVEGKCSDNVSVIICKVK